MVTFTLSAFLPGLLLYALTAYPFLLGATFPTGVLIAAMKGLYPLGSGALRACCNIFGAQQFHPVLQKMQIESYYVYFYLLNCIASLVGGMVIPVVLNYDAFAGYMILTCCAALVIIVFFLSNHRYTKMKPHGKNNLTLLAILGKLVCGLQRLERQKASNGGHYSAAIVQSIKQLAAIIPVVSLTLPFNIIYGQMFTTFVTQGRVMARADFVDAAWIQNFVPISAIPMGTLLASRQESLHISTRFLCGTRCTTLAVIWAFGVEFMIIKHYDQSSTAISILWQIPTFIFICLGEILAIPSAYKVCFLIAPKSLKELASAINVFLLDGLPQYINAALFPVCRTFFTNSDNNEDISTLSSYSTAHIQKLLWVLLGITLLGVMLNTLPMSRRFLTDTRANNVEVNTDKSKRFCRMSAMSAMSCRFLVDTLDDTEEINEGKSTRQIAHLRDVSTGREEETAMDPLIQVCSDERRMALHSATENV
jgi:dipeptide/tripeptide permease